MVPRREIACIASQSMVTSLCSDLNAARSTLSGSIPAQQNEKSLPIGRLLILWYPVGESNPSYWIENPGS